VFGFVVLGAKTEVLGRADRVSPGVPASRDLSPEKLLL
jgi:hypothetical protein